MLPAQLLWTKSLREKYLTLTTATALLPLPPPPPMQALLRMNPTGKIPTRTHQQPQKCNQYIQQLLPPSSTTSLDNNNSNDSSSNESISPWLIHNINVTDLFRTYEQQISPIGSTPNEHSTLKSQVFGLAILHTLCVHVFSDLMETTDSTEDNQLTDDEFMAITRIIYGIDAKTKSTREVKLDLLSPSARMTGNKACVVEGIANLLTKLPQNQLLNLDKIGEVELQTTYYDEFLSEIIAD
ncbi:unnamed protein product [Rhizopus stolonifer]